MSAHRPIAVPLVSAPSERRIRVAIAQLLVASRLHPNTEREARIDC